MMKEQCMNTKKKKLKALCSVFHSRKCFLFVKISKWSCNYLL